MSETRIERTKLERAWTALGFAAFCGCFRDEKIGVIVRDINGITPYTTGEIVIYTEARNDYVHIGKPVPPETLGSMGFISTVGSVVCVPKRYVERIDPRGVSKIPNRMPLPRAPGDSDDLRPVEDNEQ